MSNNNKEYTFFWFIENYSYFWQTNGEKLVSPVFTASELESTAWTLRLYPRGKYNKNKDWISIYLHRNEDDGPGAFTVKYHVSIIAEDGSSIFFRKYTSNFSKVMELGWPFVEMNDILSRRKDEYLPKDILTVRCKLSIGEEDTDKVAPIYGRTRIGIEHISFHHSVEDFSGLESNLKKIYKIRSPKQKRRVKSCVYISDGFCCEEKVMIEITPLGNGQILSKCEASLLDTSGKKIKCADADSRLDAKRKKIEKFPLSLTKDEIISKKDEYLPENKLSLIFECVFSTGIEFQQIEGNQNETTTKGDKVKQAIDEALDSIFTEKLAACPNALDDLQGIYSSKFLTDVELKTKANSFPAHQVVLCARSPVFKVMLSNDMKEKNSGSISVEDLEDDTVQKMLLFLYNDNLEDLQWETATKLYYASDKYQIKKLRLLCSSFLVDNLSTTTAAEVLLLADTYSDSDLKKVVEDFILFYDEQVFGAEEWEKFIETNPQLALKTMHLKYKKKEVGK